ncbi:helix-turn-helix domain-containing protein [Pseudalkalibacillus hwajinpoensis]|uniref:helix-turn-helix domain-containing protein n=1 Tax=Guptibacillus hwajinpoensis TaxID=208199 RepID=UPI001CFCDAB4|nr:helix-turn-helix domain-containing protein [Pseudalkalibacillus hwajinpoensis]
MESPIAVYLTGVCESNIGSPLNCRCSTLFLSSPSCYSAYLAIKRLSKLWKIIDGWQTIDIQLTHFDIATMIGSTRETVSATFKELKRLAT